MNNIVNIGASRVSEWTWEFAQKLKQILSAVPWIASIDVQEHATGPDLIAVLRTKQDTELRCVVECRAEIRPSNVAQAITQLKKWRAAMPGEVFLVLASRHISLRVAELCAEHGVSWFDLAGNCRIAAPGIYIEHTGTPPVVKPPRAQADVSSWAAARVLRVLLAPEWAGRRWTQREVESQTSNPSQPAWPTTPASLGLINKVVRHLKNEAFVEELPQRGFRVVDPVRLLQAWRVAYRYQEHRRQSCFTLLQGQKLSAALTRLAEQEAPVVYASFSAADLQAPSVRHMRTWLYVPLARTADVLAALEAKPVDSGPNVVLLAPADDGVFCLQDARSGRLSCTNPVQTYLDLRHGAGRGEEAAEAILEQRLKPAWKKAGLL